MEIILIKRVFNSVSSIFFFRLYHLLDRDEDWFFVQVLNKIEKYTFLNGGFNFVNNGIGDY